VQTEVTEAHAEVAKVTDEANRLEAAAPPATNNPNPNPEPAPVVPPAT
jgi:hypothetical protein